MLEGVLVTKGRTASELRRHASYSGVFRVLLVIGRGSRSGSGLRKRNLRFMGKCSRCISLLL